MTIILTERESKALTQLRLAVEEWRDDSEWGDVYLDNARGHFGLKEFSGILGSLAKKGLYRDCFDKDSKGIWGEVAKCTSQLAHEVQS